jgi:hypothetical protein
VAVIIAICAVVAAATAMVVIRAASRSRSSMVRRRESIGRAAVRTSRDSADTRDQMQQASTALERVRGEGASWDADMIRLTNTLRAQRAGIDGMTHGRVARLIRLAGLVSKAAQVAFLWR